MTSTRRWLLAGFALLCACGDAESKRSVKCPSGCSCTKETIICVGTSQIPRTIPNEINSLWVTHRVGGLCILSKARGKHDAASKGDKSLGAQVCPWRLVCWAVWIWSFTETLFCMCFLETGAWWMDLFLKLQKGCFHSCLLCSCCKCYFVKAKSAIDTLS